MRKFFTLAEVLIVVMVIAILASIGFPIFKSSMDKAKAKVCETNLRMLQSAIEIYALENDSLPASLSWLRESDFKKAWAKVLREQGPLAIKIAYFMVDLESQGMAYAQTAFVDRYLHGETKYLKCPEDKRDAISGGFLVSYGLNQEIVDGNVTLDMYRLAQENTSKCFLVVGDYNWVSDTGGINGVGDLATRHVEHKFFNDETAYAQFAVTGAKCKAENILKYKKPKSANDANDSIPEGLDDISMNFPKSAEVVDLPVSGN